MSLPEDPLAALDSIDRLRVGPPVLSARRVKIPYRVTRGGVETGTELIYRFGEPVFEPGSADDENLAAMIGAQVAVNYGLFCREIVFAGAYDRADRRFLERMLAITSREIFIKRILGPNRFLGKAARGLPALRLPSYLRAALRFEGPSAAGGRWAPAPERYAVLSSGGKESLVSHAALTELGYESHPIFVNESGGHWFTALAAHRFFQAHVPHTARVWTNADRVFSWLLQHLPFLRPEYRSLRDEAYPLRLWTTAVLLFGALPLVRKRRIGRLVIGNEYCSTLRLQHRGLRHWDGIYDQSLSFDRAVRRYLRRKGWDVATLSLLRPLSQLSIQKILCERYPRLLEVQISCHSAHIEGARVLPCARCEKCRRIAGFLLALGADASLCGYSAAQCQEILRAMVTRGLYLERPVTEHLAYLLQRRGLIREGRIGRFSARRRPEAVQLRFHPRISPFDEVPADLRGPLYGLFLEHAEGAVERRGRRWVEIAATPPGTPRNAPSTTPAPSPSE